MKRIPEELKEIGKNQSWLAHKSGLLKGHISDLINNKIQNPSVSTACKITRALGALSDFDYLWEVVKPFTDSA